METEGESEVKPEEATDPASSEPIVGSRVIAKGLEGEVTSYDPGDPNLTYKVLFADGMSDWFPRGFVHLLPKADVEETAENPSDTTAHVPNTGNEMEALVAFSDGGKEYYGVGDRGRVSKDIEVTASDGIARFEVTWYRTGLTSTMETDQWLKNFQFIEAGIKLPSLGDWMEALPDVSLVVSGKEYYKEGDRGRVCKENSTTESDGIDRFEIHWYRTGLTSTMKSGVWLKYFKYTIAPEEAILIGDEVEALPNASLDSGGKTYYKPGDRGRVTKENYTTTSDGIDRFEVTWYRTGLTSTMKTRMWLKNFHHIKRGKKEPNLDDEMQVLPGVTFKHDGKEYYGPGDRGKVTKESSITESDGIARFEVEWYRTKLVSTMKTELWLRNFRQIEQDKHVFSAMIELSPDIPFDFVWPALQDGVYKAMGMIHPTWRELGWKSKEDFEDTLQEAVAESGVGPIARGITQWEGEKLARAIPEVLVHVREDPEGTEAANALRISNEVNRAERSKIYRERLEDLQASLGAAALREDPDLAHIIENFTEQLQNDDIQMDELDEIEEFLTAKEAELGDVRVGYKGVDREEGEDDELMWSTILHLDKEFPFDLVWPEVQDQVVHALASTFPVPGRSGFTTVGEMESALRRGVEAHGRGPIARGLSKNDAERLSRAVGRMLQCSVEQEEREDLSELRNKLRERLADAKEMMMDLPRSLTVTLPRVEADLNDDTLFRKRYRGIEGFFNRLDTYARARPKFDLRISREQCLASALIPVLRASPWQLRPGRLHVKYLGEDADDAGGVTRAFLAQAGSILGDAQFGLFLPALRGYLQLSPLPGFLAPARAVGDVTDHPVRWCRFLGRILGMAVVHECPVGLLLVPSLCKRLLGQEICFEDLSFAPALNDAGGGGWYSSLKRMLANRAPEVVPDDDTIPRMKSSELDTSLFGIETQSFLPSRSVQTFDSMIAYVRSAVIDPDRWESAIDVVACLLRGARKKEQVDRGLEVALELLQRIAATPEPAQDVAITPSVPIAPSAYLNPSVGTWLNCTPKKLDPLNQQLPRGRRRAYQMLFTVVSDLPSSAMVSNVIELLDDLGEAAKASLADDSAMLNVAGMWTMYDRSDNKQLYFEWVQVPGSAQFTGQELTEEGVFATISSGTITDFGIRWEIDNIIFSGVLVDDGTRIVEGHYNQSDGTELGTFDGVLMKTRPELKFFRPTQGPGIRNWITLGTEDYAQSSGKLYYEVKLGLDVEGPQLGWLNSEFEKSDEVEKGVGDTAAGWAFDGMRQKFYHNGDKPCTFPRPWQGDDVIGLAVDIDGGEMQFAVNGEWGNAGKQPFEVGAFPIFPAVSVRGYFALNMSKDAWQYGPPDESYASWGINGTLCRPPALLDGPQSDMPMPSLMRQTSLLPPTSLERVTSRVPGITEEELSSSNLPAFAEAVARKTLVTNLQPYLGPMTEEFRKIAGEHKLQSLSWEQLQERIAGRQMDPAGWIEEWKSRTGYTFCDDAHEVIQLWWSFVEERSAEELPKLFEWCTNFPAIPITPWKFHIQLLDEADKLPTMNSCRTDDRGIENRGVPEPIIYLPCCGSKSVLFDKMSKVNWQKGASNAMILV